MIELPPLPALVVGTVHHTRHRPLRHTFDYRVYEFLIDLADPPTLPRWLAPWTLLRGEDHLDGAAGLPALQANVIRVLERSLQGPPVSRVLMLANARVLGHVFDPLTLFWCLDAQDDLIGVVMEVHNTYGERHAYVISGADVHRASVDKKFHVSPFNDVSGEYDVRIRLSATKVLASILLKHGDQPLVTAVLSGVPKPMTTSAVLKTVVASPLMTWKVSALIRVHGIWLWIKRLPVQPRKPHDQESVR